MACHSMMGFTSLSKSFLFLDPLSKSSKFQTSSSITSHIQIPQPGNDDWRRTETFHLDFLKLSVTLTVISASLAQSFALAAPTVKEKKRASRKTISRKSEGLSPEQLKSWAEGLPVVSNRIPHTELLQFKEEGKLKHVIKQRSARLRQRAEPVLVVFDDSRVLRTVLPSYEGDRKFWDSWNELKIDSLCVNAYSPPVKIPELPSPYLGFLLKLPVLMSSFTKPKKETKRAAELRRMREELQREKNLGLQGMWAEKEMIEKAMKNQKKEEDRKRRREIKEKKYEESLREAKKRSQRMANVWTRLANDSIVTTALGFIFFVIFYRTVVLSYKKQKKDYEDRLKIEKAEAEERKKMRELESELQGISEDDVESQTGKGEENAYMKMAKQFMKSGARVRVGQSRGLPQYLDRDADVKFSDVAGLGKIRLELEEIVKFFTHGEMYRRRGLKIPGGILLCGPPGVGKTLLAKAVAGEAGVNFFSISASQFVEIYVGVGASRVRSLYQEAKENAPSVVFIDEIDAVGRARGLIKGSGGRERDATLNQLLVCLDGFEGRGEVITIASTNRPDILDPALVRPGRFDRKIRIPRPSILGRTEILKVHARKKPMADDVDFVTVASATEGMVGAELANIIEVAAVNMIRDGKTEITTDDLLQAAQIEEKGMRERKEWSMKTWRQIAINEASAAIVAINFPDVRNVEFITIAPRAGRELGYVRMKMDAMKWDSGILTRQSILDHITVQLSPRAADELCYGEEQLSTIWAESADEARFEARALILGGLSDKNYGLSSFWVPDRINEIDLEAMSILYSCYERAKQILEQNRKLLDVVVDELVEKKSLTKQEFFHLVELHGSVAEMPPSILEIRAARRAKFEHVTINLKEQDMSSNA